MKKIVSILLAVLLIASVSVVSVGAIQGKDAQYVGDAIAAYEQEQGTTVETKRYYFLMPNGETGLKAKTGEVDGVEIGDFTKSWYNDYNEDFVGGIYWWGATDAPNPDAWMGYRIQRIEGTNVYYADVPASAPTIIWNNGVDGGTDNTQPQYTKAAQTKNVGAMYYLPGDSDYYPDGIPKDQGFTGMIYVTNPDDQSINEYSGVPIIGGDWFYYYGGDCFGIVKDGGDDLESNCMNEAHDHSVMLGDVTGDGAVTVLDATRIQRYCAKLCALDDGTAAYTEATGTVLATGDVTGDGAVSVLDATRIQRYVAKLCNLDGTTPYAG